MGQLGATLASWASNPQLVLLAATVAACAVVGVAAPALVRHHHRRARHGSSVSRVGRLVFCECADCGRPLALPAAAFDALTDPPRCADHREEVRR